MWFVVDVSQSMSPAVCERMSQDGMPCQRQARDGEVCNAAQVIAMHQRTMLWCKTVCIIWVSSAEVEQWATARRCNATEQWGAIPGRAQAHEVMNARLGGWGHWGGDMDALTPPADIRYCLRHCILD